MKICGRKLSLCGIIVSVWGLFQLVLIGIFYNFTNAALLEEFAWVEEGGVENPEECYEIADRNYVQSAYNQWVAASIYVFTLVVSGHQFYLNCRSSPMFASDGKIFIWDSTLERIL